MLGARSWLFLSHTKSSVIALDAFVVALATSLVLLLQWRNGDYGPQQVTLANYVLLLLMSVTFYCGGFIRAGAYVSRFLGRSIDETHSYATGLFWAGQAPIVACLAMALLWGTAREDSSAKIQ